MLIKRVVDNPAPGTTGKGGRLRPTLTVLFLAAVLFTAGALSQRQGWLSVSPPSLSETVKRAGRLLSGITVTPPRIELDLKQKYYLKLYRSRALLHEQGSLGDSGTTWYPASIRCGNRPCRILVKLKRVPYTGPSGGPLWGLHVRMRNTGKDAVFGMKRFSLFPSDSRNQLSEWMLHEAAARENLLTPRYAFAEAFLNGERLGLYAVEEDYDQTMIEFRRRRDGPIVKFGQDSPAVGGSGGEPAGSSLYTAPVVATHTADSPANPGRVEALAASLQLLDSFRARKNPPAGIFVRDRLARFLALGDLFGCNDQNLAWFNLRFYYDPLTSLLEPVMLSKTAGSPLSRLCYFTDELSGVPEESLDFSTLIFSDPEINTAYFQELERVSEPAYIDRLYGALSSRLEASQPWFYRDYPAYDLDLERLRLNQAWIRNALRPEKGLQAYLSSTPGSPTLRLELANNQRLPLEVVAVFRSGQPWSRLPVVVSLPPMPISSPLAYEFVPLPADVGTLPDQATAKPLEVGYRVAGLAREFRARVYPQPGLLDLIRHPSNLSEFPFLQVDDPGKLLTFRPGRWILDRDLVIPAGYTVEAGPGTALDLVKSAALLSYSPLRFTGAPGKPVSLESSDKTGQGLAVLNAHGRSLLSGVTFSDLSPPVKGGWILTASVTFYESPFTLSDCRFSTNRSGSWLNPVRTDFILTRCRFLQSATYAIDGEYVKGEINSCTFLESGDDAIDIDWGQVAIRDVLVNGSRSKGISIGKSSRASITRATVKNAPTGVASHDRASVTVFDLTLAGCLTDLSAYLRRPEFGGATLKVRRLRCDHDRLRYLADKDSRLYYEGNLLPSTANNATLETDVLPR